MDTPGVRLVRRLRWMGCEDHVAPIGELAFLVFVSQFLFGLTDIYWVAGSFSLSMLIIGLAVGVDPQRTETVETNLLSSSST